MKKALTLFLSLAMILSLFAIATFADAKPYGDMVIEGTALLIIDKYNLDRPLTQEDFSSRDVEVIKIDEEHHPRYALVTLSEEETKNFADAIARLNSQNYEFDADIVSYIEHIFSVRIKAEYSAPFKTFTPEDFPEIEGVTIVDKLKWLHESDINSEWIFDENNLVDEEGRNSLLLYYSPEMEAAEILDTLRELEKNPLIDEVDLRMFPHIADGGTTDCTKTPEDRTAHNFDEKLNCSKCGKNEFDLFGNHVCTRFDGYDKCIACGRENYRRNNPDGQPTEYSYCETFDHTPGAEATKTTDQVCTVCGAVVQAATGTPCERFGHTPGAEATKTTDQVCTVCGAVLKKAQGNPHTAAGDLFGATAMLSLAAAAAVLLKKKH